MSTEHGPLMRNYYRCPECDHAWNEVYDCGCDSECGECGCEDITPVRSVPLVEESRLEYLRQELQAERISYDELHELQSLAAHIDPNDTELLEAAGVPESWPECKQCGGNGIVNGCRCSRCKGDGEEPDGWDDEDGCDEIDVAGLEIQIEILTSQRNELLRCLKAFVDPWNEGGEWQSKLTYDTFNNARKTIHGIDTHPVMHP